MAIDINNIGATQIRDKALREGARESAKGVEQATSNDNRGRVEVDLSGDAERLSRLEAEVKSLPDIDEARVESIRSQIAEGRYHVDPDRLAEKFIALESELAQ